MLSMKCQYALHALVYIAEADPASLVNIRQIAERKNIPKKFLENILMELKKRRVYCQQEGKMGRLSSEQASRGDPDFASDTPDRRGCGDASMCFLEFLPVLRAM
jgi:hypothetical protein